MRAFRINIQVKSVMLNKVLSNYGQRIYQITVVLKQLLKDFKGNLLRLKMF